MPDPLRTGCVANFHIPPDLETISITDEAYLSTLAKITFTSVRSALDLVYARLEHFLFSHASYPAALK